MSKHIGKRFGRLYVEEFFYKHNGRQNNIYYRCSCDCGNVKNIRGDALTSKRPTRSCGCIFKEDAKKKALHMGKSNKTHGMSGTRIYKSWDAMKSRCDNPNDKDFVHYGERGISYDKAWSSFDAFYNDMKVGYQKDLTLDRIDVNGNYNKENCRWATVGLQNQNKRTTLFLEYCGIVKHLNEWSEDLGIHPSTIKSRLRMGWNVEEALTVPVNVKEFKGVYQDKVTQKWRAYVKQNGRRVHVGYFDSEESAIEASGKYK